MPGFGAGVVEPRRITGALKLMLGRFGGAWKEAGSPLGRLACVALLVCWTPGGGANPGAEDMPGGGPRPGGGAMPGAPLEPGKDP